jgi:L-threonylcarbamoyladenylate synthase
LLGETIGLRIPDYDLIRVLLNNLKRPLIGTSANISGKPGSVRIKEVLDQFKGQDIVVINIGDLEPNKPSTVVDFTGPKIKILREGAISKKWMLSYFKNLTD